LPHKARGGRMKDFILSFDFMQENIKSLAELKERIKEVEEWNNEKVKL
jgi:hypothetical protein